MRTHRYWFLALIVPALMLAACTRERPTPEPIPTEEPTAQALPTAATVIEPSVVDAAEEDGGDADSEADEPTPELDEEFEGPIDTFQYTVQAGDTLLDLAIQYGTDTDTIKELNNLFTDELSVGLPLNIPLVEGVTAPGQPTPTPGPYAYTVQPGDTIGSIALKFGKDMIELIEANGLIESDILSVGQEILIPDYTPTSVDPPSAGAVADDDSVTHIVAEGETLSTIAELYGVDSNAILRFNNLANPNLLRLGQALQIPGVSPGEAARLSGQIHVVQTGESLSQIAAQYGVAVEEIIALNEINNPNDIRVGQELVIPQ